MSQRIATFIILFFFSFCAAAQIDGLIKIHNGFLMYYDDDEYSFTIEIIGDVGLKEKPGVFFLNGDFVQFQFVDMDFFHSDNIIALERYRDYEKQYIEKYLT